MMMMIALAVAVALASSATPTVVKVTPWCDNSFRIRVSQASPGQPQVRCIGSWTGIEHAVFCGVLDVCVRLCQGERHVADT